MTAETVHGPLRPASATARRAGPCGPSGPGPTCPRPKFQRPKQGNPFTFSMIAGFDLQDYWVQSVMA